LEEPGEPLVVADGVFPVEQQREPFVKRERGEIGHAALFLERGGHAREFERVQRGERLFDQHVGAVSARVSGASTTVVSWS